MFYGDWLQRRAALSQSKVALIDAVNNDRPITYIDWNHRANRLADFMHGGLGIRKGDRVSVYSMNRVEYLDALFACNKLGAILQVVNWRLKPLELVEVINDVSPRALFFSSEWVEQVDELRPRLRSVENYIGWDRVTDDRDFLWRAEEGKWSDEQPQPVELDWEDPWFVCYTGGTTGLPKGAIFNYRSVTWNAVNTAISWGLRQDDVVPQYMPMFHTGGLTVLTLPLVYVGATSIICPGFGIDQLFDQIESLGVTFFFAVPTMFLMMFKNPRWETLDLSHVRLVMAGGGNCPTSVYERFMEKGVEFKEGYGLTEGGPNTFWLPSHVANRKVGSVGRPLFHIDVRVVDEQGNEVGANQVGQLLIRGPHIFGGYWNNPPATAETVIDGWLHTGDLARKDEDGDFFIVGRLKEMIKSGGENVYPNEVEDVMHSHPSIIEAALIPVSDAKWVEVGRAIVVLKPGEVLSEVEMTTWMRERMASYKIPKSIVFIDELPKTAANKVDKKMLIEQYGH